MSHGNLKLFPFALFLALAGAPVGALAAPGLAASVVAQPDRAGWRRDDLRPVSPGPAESGPEPARLAALEERWFLARAALVGLALALAAAIAVATAALGRHRRSERYARLLSRELEDRRAAALAERQESARRILALETRLRTLEAQRSPRVVIGGRGG